MKKKKCMFLMLTLSVSMMASMLSGCGGQKPKEADTEQVSDETKVEETEEKNASDSQEDELERTYTFDQLSIAMSYNEEHEIDAAGKFSVKYTEQYGEVCFAIPDDVDHNRIQKIVLNVASSDVKGLSVKMLKSETCYEDSEQIAVAYETNMVERGGDMVSAANNFGVMGLTAGYAVEIDSVTFYLNEAAGAVVKTQDDIPRLADAVTEKMGDDFLMGAVLSGTTIQDEAVCNLVRTHFNAVTLENELKPDSILNANGGDKCSSTETVSLNGEDIEVPKMSFARAEMLLDKIYDWNREDPEHFIKVRGHVLVWHSQTPEWFFHEEYNSNKPYVTPDEMTKRQEWYIKSVLEHFTGADSKYKDMFYGWDVVNEAVSDATGTYRADFENSSWWAVYKSNTYIKNAFVFANKYAPESLELYYNDYNDCVSNKVKGICQLLTDVKATPGARITGFGMQGHNGTEGSPTMGEFENAARAYAEIVDKVQFTEFDLKASKSFDGTEEGTKEEYTKEAYRYKEFYDTVQAMKADGVAFTGWTVWGTVDRYSWLQSASNVGGAADGSQKQCPLLFDDAYQAKPAFWAFVDASKLEPNIKVITVNESPAGDYSTGKDYTFSQNDTKVSFIPVWNEDGLKFMLNVVDKTDNESDEVVIYLSTADGIKTYSVSRADAKEAAAGYQAEIAIELPKEQLLSGEDLLIDVAVVDGADKIAFNDATLSQETEDTYYAKAQIRPYMMIQKGTASVDGKLDGAYDAATEIPLTMRLGAKAEATAKLLWDEEYLYVFVDVKDEVLNGDSENEYERDSFEIFVDENNHKSAEYEADDKQYRVDYTGHESFNGEKCIADNIESVSVETENGYAIEAKLKWTDLKPEAGNRIGIDLQINDADGSGSRIGTVNWYDLTGQGWSSPAVYGEAKLMD